MSSNLNFEIIEKFNRMRQLMMQMPIDDCISHGEFGMMNIIKENSSPDGITVSQIAAKLEITTPAVSRTLKSLDEKGFIERRVNMLNRRSTIVRLTEKGEKILDNAQKNMLSLISFIKEKMGTERVNEFNVLYGEMLEYMCRYVNQKEDKTDD